MQRLPLQFGQAWEPAPVRLTVLPITATVSMLAIPATATVEVRSPGRSKRFIQWVWPIFAGWAMRPALDQVIRVARETWSELLQSVGNCFKSIIEIIFGTGT